MPETNLNNDGLVSRIAASPSLLVASIAALLLFTFSSWIGFGFILPYMWTDLSCEARGQFGDMFGAANSLFSGFAAVLSFVSVVLILHGIKKQKEEMNEIRRQHSVSEKNAKLQKLIEMANTFYKLEFIRQFDTAKGVLEYATFRSTACEDEQRTASSTKVFGSLSRWLHSGNTDYPIKDIFEYMSICSPGYPVAPGDPPKEFATFAYIINWICIYSSIILSETPPISEFDFLRHHWARIRHMIIPIVDSSVSSGSKIRLNFLQDSLLKIDEYYKK